MTESNSFLGFFALFFLHFVSSHSDVLLLRNSFFSKDSIQMIVMNTKTRKTLHRLTAINVAKT